MPPRRRKRLDPAVFALPVPQMRAGFFSERDGERARAAVAEAGGGPRVVLQLSATAPGWLSGIDEAVAILKLCAEEWSALTVHALLEGDRLDAWDTVLTIDGPYRHFAHLESVLVGTLARRTRICTTVRTLVEAARPKPVLFLGARSEHWATQAGDGFAAHVGGASGVSTVAQASLFGGKPVGVVPHSLVAAHGGETARAARAFAAAVAADVDVVAPVDYENDCVRTSVEVARALEGRLWGVRLDTSPYMVDRSVLPQLGTFPPAGVNPPLVWNVRNALDAEGFGDVKIVVGGGGAGGGGANLGRVRWLEEEKAPVDLYAAGASLLGEGLGAIDFAADVVQVEGAPQTRVGREPRANAKLERVR